MKKNNNDTLELKENLERNNVSNEKKKSEKKKKKFDSDTFRAIKKLERYIKKYYILIIINMLLSILAGSVSAAPVALVKRLFDKGLVGKNEKDIIYASAAMIILAVLGAIFLYYNTLFSGKISSTIYKNIIDDMYEKIQELDMEFFSNNKTGDLMTRVSADSSNVNTLILDTFTFCSMAFSAIFYLLISLFVDFKLTVGVLLFSPVIYMIGKRYSRKLKGAGNKNQEATGNLNAKLQESLSGIRVIKAFAAEEEEIKNFNIMTEKLRRYSLRNMSYLAKSSSISEAINYIMVALILLFGGFRVVKGSSFTAGDFVTVVGAISAMYSPIKRSLAKYNEISLKIPSIYRCFEILDIEPKIKNDGKNIDFGEFKDKVVLKDVKFSYSDNDKEILKGINLEAKKGETVALVGNSGGGKSTIVNLIPRFFEVTAGSIEIDGVNIKDYNLKSLRKNIGIVPQETFLFSGTVAENIKYGKQDATFEEIIEAARKANAHNFIEKLENGYETEIGERGVKLSGGQKQRIAIARAILENPQILILDEATSALDNESEQIVQDALEKLMIGKTTFVIAHRLSTIVNSDKIAVIQHGELVELGTHEELLELDGIYSKLYKKSFKKEKSDAVNNNSSV